MQHERFIEAPCIDMYAGIRVTKNTKLEYKNEHVDQKLDNLVFHSITRVSGEGYDSVYDTIIYLKEGDVLIFEDKGRGYIKPVQRIVSVSEAIEELRCIEDMKEATADDAKEDVKGNEEGCS